MNNVTVRTLSGIAFLAIMVAGLLVDKLLFAGLLIVILGLMMAEFFKMTMGDCYKLARSLAIVSGVCLFALIFITQAYGVNHKIIALAILPLILVMINSLYMKDKGDFGKFSYIYTAFLYIAIPISLSNLIAFKGGDFNGMLILCFFIIIWSSDVGAFAIGSAFGQKLNSKKLFPSISPHKSWVGFWGGLAFAIVSAIAMHFTGLIDFPLLHCIIVAILMDIAGVYGDLFESQWKRYCEVKDSGSIMPGHGGMLDRFDSALFAIPVGAIYLSLFNLI